ncbi:MAG: NADH-quinone oxidoreductase subunit C [Tessaracoccus sp.]
MAELVERSQWREHVAQAKSAGYTFLNNLTAVDEIADDKLRVLLRLENPVDGAVLDVATELDRDDPHLDGITGIFPGASWLQRQAHDFFGIAFVGDDQRPLIVHDGSTPLRKDALLSPRVEKRWPGALEPGESTASPSRRKLLPAGVPDPAVLDDPEATPADIALSATGTRVRRRP